MDQAIQVAIVLLILSLITEKITNFIKLQSRSLSLRENDAEAEKQRELRVLSVNVSVGIAVALAIKADALQMMRFKPSDMGFGWQGVTTFDPWVIVGCILTGAFLSFGSKFFHDLADLLLQVKQLKQRLNDEKTYELSNIQNVDAYVAMSDDDILRKALEAQRSYLMAIPNVVSVGLGKDSETGKRCIEVHVSDSHVGTVPPYVIAPLPGNQTKPCRVRVISSGPVTTLQGIGPGNGIRNQASLAGAYGTLGCIVRLLGSGEDFMLSCYHAVKSARQSYELFKPIDTLVIRDADGEAIGEIAKAVRTAYVDAALIQPYPGEEYDATIPGVGRPRTARYLSPDDVTTHIPVKFYGASSHGTNSAVVGVVTGDSYRVAIQYPNEPMAWELSDLIAISKTANGDSSVSAPGDSGSVAVDEQGYGIGLVVAGSSTHTFLIPLPSVLEDMSAKIPEENA